MNDNSVSLESLGWTKQNREGLQLANGHGVSRVVVEHRGAYELLGPHGSREAVLDSATRDQADEPMDYPAVGDWVVHSLEPIDNRRVAIVEILPRHSVITRRASGAAPLPQVVGANIDTLVIVTSSDQDVDEHLIERYLVTAIGGGASPVIAVNKTDLGDGDAIRERLIRRGVEHPILMISAITGDGMSALADLLVNGTTLAFTGPSGVGKSTLVNLLVGDSILATAAVSEEGSGRHTTVRREMLVAGGGVLIDTPGLREVQLWNGDGLDEVFSDVARLAIQCKFANCSHRDEPDCGVLDALARGDLNPSRLASYIDLCHELSELADEINEYQRTRRRQRDARRN